MMWMPMHSTVRFKMRDRDGAREVVKDWSGVVDPETRRSEAARKYSATIAARATAQLFGSVKSHGSGQLGS